MVKRIAFVLILLSSCTILAFSKMLLERSRSHSDEKEIRYLPSAAIAKTLSLGHPTIAMDFAWISTLTNLHIARRQAVDAELLSNNFRTIHGLDPLFLPQYQAFSSFYTSPRSQLEEEEIILLNDFLDLGMAYFPDNGELAYIAMTNLIGRSAEANRERRLREIEVALDYLRVAYSLPGAPERIALNYLWFISRRNQLLGRERSFRSQADYVFLLDLYFWVTEPEIRRVLRRELASHAQEFQWAILTIEEQWNELDERYAMARRYYLPLDFWLPIVPNYDVHDQ